MSCPLCEDEKNFLWHRGQGRSYFQCQSCFLIYVSREELLSAQDEKKRYDLHQNHADDPRYCEYLSKISEAIIPYLRQGDRGLDFGCGESTLLADIFGKRGFVVDSYDLYYHLRPGIWSQKYHFIILSEVIEHLSQLLETMRKLRALLFPQGHLFIKTMLAPEGEEKFATWFYKNDPTHIQFFNEKSLNFLADTLQLQGPEAKPLGKDLYRLWSE